MSDISVTLDTLNTEVAIESTNIGVTIEPLNVEVSVAASNIEVTIVALNIDINIDGGSIGLQVSGTYLDDDDAILDGKQPGNVYYLAENNNYTLPAGLLKQIQ